MVKMVNFMLYILTRINTYIFQNPVAYYNICVHFHRSAGMLRFVWNSAGLGSSLREIHFSFHTFWTSSSLGYVFLVVRDKRIREWENKHMMPLKALALSWRTFTSANISLDKTSYMAKSHINGAEKSTLAALGKYIAKIRCQKVGL